MDPNAPLTELPHRLLAIDLASALHLRLFDPGSNFASVDYGGGAKLAGGAGMLGDPQNPQVVVAPNGGADLIYLPQDECAAAWRPISSHFSPPRIMSAPFSSMTGWANFPARCP